MVHALGKGPTTMRAAIISLTLLSGIVRMAFGFAEPMPLARQVRDADAILRVVVVSYEILKANEKEDGFQAIAKCRVIEDYKGDYRLGQFVFIPCAYNCDENPSPIEAEGDHVVFLDTFEVAPMGHPLAFNAVHSIGRGWVKDPERDGVEIDLADFVARISRLREAQAVHGQPVSPPRVGD